MLNQLLRIEEELAARRCTRAGRRFLVPLASLPGS
jgi:hypothetical protein